MMSRGCNLIVTVNVTSAVPLPDAWLVRTIHVTLLAAVQPQPALAVTVMASGPPVGPSACVGGATLTCHAAASWRRVTLSLFTLSAVWRNVGAGFGITSTVTSPLP
jgi:hypothetical protein